MMRSGNWSCARSMPGGRPPDHRRAVRRTERGRCGPLGSAIRPTPPVPCGGDWLGEPMARAGRSRAGRRGRARTGAFELEPCPCRGSSCSSRSRSRAGRRVRRTGARVAAARARRRCGGGVGRRGARRRARSRVPGAPRCGGRGRCIGDQCAAGDEAGCQCADGQHITKADLHGCALSCLLAPAQLEPVVIRCAPDLSAAAERGRPVRGVI